MSHLIKTRNVLFNELGKQFKISKSAKLLPAYNQKRNLNVHEYVGIKLLNENGVNVPRFGVATTPEEASKIASSLSGKFKILKKFFFE